MKAIAVPRRGAACPSREGDSRTRRMDSGRSITADPGQRQAHHQVTILRTMPRCCRDRELVAARGRHMLVLTLIVVAPEAAHGKGG